MIDKRKLHDDLTEAFIQYQYRLENPMPSTTETNESRREHYRHDNMFNRKVESLTCGVLSIVDKYLAD